MFYAFYYYSEFDVTFQEKDNVIHDLQQSEQDMRRKLWHGEEARRLTNKVRMLKDDDERKS